VDEDGQPGGPYVVCIDPKTGKNTSAKTRFGDDYDGGMQGGDVTSQDMDGHSLWVVLASTVHPSDQGNFSLYSITDGVLDPSTPPVQLKMPTADLQGPEGLVHVAKDKLLAMTGEEQQGWGLVRIPCSPFLLQELWCLRVLTPQSVVCNQCTIWSETWHHVFVDCVQHPHSSTISLEPHL
jgi:hypothetical protein